MADTALQERPASTGSDVAVMRHENPVMQMISEAVAAGQPVEVIRELMAMSKELAADEARRAFDEAISAAKAELRPIARTRDGHNSKYADFAAVANAVDPVLSEHGLSYRHRSSQGDRISVTCILSHTKGHSEETTLQGPADTSGNKNAIQAIGSTLTYLQRYTLLLALGLATTQDDDGRAAGQGELISEGQREELQHLIEETSSDIERLCSYFKVESLTDLPAKKFQNAKNMLEAKRNKK